MEEKGKELEKGSERRRQQTELSNPLPYIHLPHSVESGVLLLAPSLLAAHIVCKPSPLIQNGPVSASLGFHATEQGSSLHSSQQDFQHILERNILSI